MAEIHDMRITLIWTEVYLDHLQNTTTPFSFLGRAPSYKSRVRGIASDPDGLTMPWKAPAGNWFWTHYLGHIPGATKPTEAWNGLLPLRLEPPFKIKPIWTDGSQRIFSEAYFYPFGHTLAITIHLRGEYTLEQAVAIAHQAVRTGDYEIEKPGGLSQTGNLSQVAQSGLGTLRQIALGDPLAGATALPQPFTLTSVVKGSGVDATIALASAPEASAIQHALEGLTNWQPNWETINLPALTPENVLLDKAVTMTSPGDVLYAGKRGRTVWYPGKFTLSEPSSALGCYHRNLVLASLHTEMLARFSEILLIEFPTHTYRFNPILRTPAETAANILSRLYWGEKPTYRTGSVRAQIDQSNYKPTINAIAANFNVTPL